MALWPSLVLDSGASMHVVGDRRLLSNIRNAPAGMEIVAVDDNTLPITKIGDIRMIDAGFTIPDVYLAPGMKADIISVRQLTRQGRIRAWFDQDQAKLYAGRQLVGVAVAPPDNEYGLYELQFLRMPKSSLNGEMRSVLPLWCGGFSALTGLGSVLSWLKALVCEGLFSAGPEEKTMPEPEPRVSDRIRRDRRRKKGKNSGRRR